MCTPGHPTTSFFVSFFLTHRQRHTLLPYLLGPPGWGWSGLNTPRVGMSLMAVAQLNLKQGSMQASLWDAGSKNCQWKESWAWRGVCESVCVKMCCEYVRGCVCSPCILSKNCQLQTVKEDRGRGCYWQFQPRSQHFHFVRWKPSVKLWWRAICISGWLWRGRLCSLPSKSRARTLLAPKTCPPHHQPAPTLCPSPTALLALLFGCFGQWLFHYCVVWPWAPAGSPFINPLWGFSKQSKGTPPNLSTHTPKIRWRHSCRKHVHPSETKAVWGDVSKSIIGLRLYVCTRGASKLWMSTSPC